MRKKTIWIVLIPGLVLIASVAFVLCIAGNRPREVPEGAVVVGQAAQHVGEDFSIGFGGTTFRFSPTNWGRANWGRAAELGIVTEDSGDLVTLSVGESAPIPGIGTVTVHNIRTYRCGTWTDVVLIIDESERGK